MSNQSVGPIIRAAYPDLEAGVIGQVERYYSLLLEENRHQNLTRLSVPQDFVDGHFIDCIELLKTGALESPCMDLGSGGGVPGLLCAILEPNTEWILAESEGWKARFLESAVQKLGLRQVSVYPGRAEDYLKLGSVGTVVVRAVSRVEKIIRWIGSCSTWNNLVLLKSRGWAEEWKSFIGTQGSTQLIIKAQHEYRVGVEQKYRVIVNLVPRGTKLSERKNPLAPSTHHD